MHRFVRLLIAGRLQWGAVMADPGLTLNQLLGQARLEWHGVKVGQPDWSEDSHTLALTAWSLSRHLALHIMVNAWREPLAFELPAGGWRRWLDTSLPSPADIVLPDEATAVGDGIYTLPAHSVGVLFSRAADQHSRELSCSTWTRGTIFCLPILGERISQKTS